MPARRTVLGIQVLRGVAAALVVFHHSTVFWARETGRWSDFWPTGAMGVDIFFVISGFVMFYTAGEERGGVRARRFLERRFFRLAPMYWLITAIFILEFIVLHFHPQLRTHADLYPRLTLPWLVSSVTLVPYNHGGFIGPIVGVGWTLSVECLFYLVFALAILLPFNKRLFLSVVMIAGAAYGWNDPQTRPEVLRLFSPLLLEFLAGVFIAWLSIRTVRSSRWCWVLVAVAAMLATVPRFPDQAAVRLFVFGIPAIVIVGGVTLSGSQFSQFWPRWLLLLGDASYSLYLIHLFVLRIVFRVCEAAGVFTNPTRTVEAAVTSACLLLSVAVAVPLYVWIERPLNDALRRRVLHSSRPLQVESAPV